MPCPDTPCVLRPYTVEEAITVAEAARLTRKSPGTIRNWASLRDLGRRVGGGDWQLSRVALAMFLDGDREALALYLKGDRSSAKVVGYFAHLSIPLPDRSALALPMEARAA